MQIFETINSLKVYLKENVNLSVGFVPTMGALHDGHLSLIETSKQNNQITVCSIFVNPTQFNDPKDFEKYPITIEQDIELLSNKNCDVLFLPSVEEIYSEGLELKIKYELGIIETLFDGAHRPGHFQGVCQVVDRLLQIVLPNNLYLGQKDYQQCMIIKKLLELTNLNKDIKIHVCETKREHDGLAMSSRNKRLSSNTRKHATGIYLCFCNIKNKIDTHTLPELLDHQNKYLLENGFSSVDYLTLANAKTLEPIEKWNNNEKTVILAAATIDGVRLIDNMILN